MLQEPGLYSDMQDSEEMIALPRWLWALFVVTLLTLGFMRISGFRFHPHSTVGVKGTVIRTAPFSEGLALLVKLESGGCHVTFVRRFGPLWRGEGGANCGRADRTHPFTYTGWGRGWGSGDSFRSALAVGGIISDARIAAIRMAGQTEQPVSPETGYLGVYETYKFNGFPPTQALAADGSVLYTIHTGTNWKWMPPPDEPPLPGRVTRQEELGAGTATGRITAETPRSSTWQNGEVLMAGEWQPFYVWADGREGLCGLGTAVGGTWSPWYQVYPCPEPMGALRITGIDATGRILSFEAPDGRTGRFDLATNTWHMDEE